MQTTLDMVLGETLRMVIIEALAEDQFALVVSIGYSNYTVCLPNGHLYLRASIREVMQDLSLHDLGEIFIHQKHSSPLLDIPDYFCPTDFGNGVIHLSPNALTKPAENYDLLKDYNIH